MYPSLLVPLDRSSFAEQALPLALAISRRGKGRLDLVEVHAVYALGDAHAGWLPYQSEQDAECRKQEQIYLDATARWVTSGAPVSADTCVLSGSAVLPASVAESILERARTRNADLIVMTTHGRGQLSRFASGSVADELIRRAPLPVLLVRPNEQSSEILPEPVLDNILIPLDGSALAEKVLEPALNLARLMGARCSLVRVIKPRFSVHDDGPGDSTDAEQAAAYLETIAGKLRAAGLDVQTRVVVAARVAEAILAEAKAQASNLIALATHGRGGLKRLLLGSVADKLIQTGATTVLICGPTGKDL